MAKGTSTSTGRQLSSSYISQKKTAATLSLLEKLGAIPAVLSVLANILAAFITGPLRSRDKKPASLYTYIFLTAVRTLIRKLTVRQQHYITDTTDDAYLVACKKRKFAPNSEVLADGTQAHWIGSSKAQKIVINFHVCGGYGFPAGPEMFEFMFQIVDVLNKENKDVACLFLSYDLAPGAVYPRQLQQASALLAHVLDTLHIAPSNIILTGDSAGANLCLGLLSHISHPHPSPTIPALQLSAPLRGAVLISPWVDFDLSAASFQRNKYKDCIEPASGKQWSTAFMNCPWPHTANSDFYNQPTSAPESWWAGLQVEQVLIVAGDEEVLIDGIVKFEKKFRAGFEKASGNGDGKRNGKGALEFIVGKGEFHDQPNLDLQMGVKEKDECLQAREIKRWISSRF